MQGRTPGKKETKPRGTAFDRAVRLLASRRQTTVELRRKLAQRGFEKAEIEETLARLADLRYVDDSAAAHDWADELARTGGQGKAKALQKMIARGLPADRARQELDRAWDDELEHEHAKVMLAKLLRVTPQLADTSKGRAKLWRSLLNRGFHTEIVRDLIRALPGTEDEGSL
ncbi:RecX family transcriptional regulator [bacterium]|nr:RecX family transcriptional regulator [bacterium]